MELLQTILGTSAEIAVVLFEYAAVLAAAFTVICATVSFLCRREGTGSLFLRGLIFVLDLKLAAELVAVVSERSLPAFRLLGVLLLMRLAAVCTLRLEKAPEGRRKPCADSCAGQVIAETEQTTGTQAD